MTAENIAKADLEPISFASDGKGERFRLLRIIGEGARGKVFEAEHLLLQQSVAIKVLKQSGIDDDHGRARFLNEARVCMQMHHPNIAQFMSFGFTDNKEPYLVMEMAQGCSLDTLLKAKGQLPLALVIEIGAQLTAALSHAHQLGIIHRDVKPSNVIVDLQDSAAIKVKLLDFGLAKMLAPDLQDAPQLTKTGLYAGTPLYMSPEQCKAQQGDSRMDIYSLGCLLYECATGHAPFSGSSDLEIMSKHILQPLSFDKSSNLPEILCQLLLKCMDKDPAGRYQSADELGTALRNLPADLAYSQDKKRVSGKILCFSAIAAAVIILLGTILAFRPNSKSPIMALPVKTTPPIHKGLGRKDLPADMLAQEATSAKDPKIGIQYMLDAVQQVKKTKDTFVLAKYLDQLARLYLVAKKLPEAKIALDDAERLAGNNATLLQSIYIDISNYFMYSKDAAKSLQAAEHSISLFPRGEAPFMSYFCAAERAASLPDWKKVEKYVPLALKVSSRTNFFYGSDILEKKDQSDNPFEVFYLQYYLIEMNATLHSQAGVRAVYPNLIAAARNAGSECNSDVIRCAEDLVALNFHKEAEGLCDYVLQNTDQAKAKPPAITYALLIYCHNHFAEFDKSIECKKKGLALVENKYSIATAYLAMADADRLLQQGQAAQALIEAKAAIANFGFHDYSNEAEKRYSVRILSNAAKIAVAQKDYITAITWLKQAQKILQVGAFLPRQAVFEAEINRQLGNAYDLAGNKELAAGMESEASKILSKLPQQ